MSRDPHLESSHRGRGRSMYRAARRRAAELQFDILEDRQLLTALSVLNINDSGSGSLRNAIATANTDAQAGTSDTITFASTLDGDTITLSTGDLELGQGGTGSGTITVSGANQITISGGGVGAVFEVDSGVTADLTGLTITAGTAANGGGISNSGTLAVSNSTITGNTASYIGGGIYNAGTLTVANSTISNNAADADADTYGGIVLAVGGGIYNQGTATVTNSTVAENSAGALGLTNGAIADAYGGGIGNEFLGVLHVTNSTLSNNAVTATSDNGVAGGYGGGIANSGTATLQTTIVAGNSAPAANDFYEAISTTVLGTTYVATITATNSLIGDGTSTGLTDVNGDQIGTSDNPILANLAPLAYYGGPTETMALLPGSPAIGTGIAVMGITTDQRGDARPFNHAYDLGAFQNQGSALVVTTASDAPSHAGESLRDAIDEANEDAAAGQSDAITFAAGLNGQTITLTQGVLELGADGASSGTITVSGANQVTVSGGGISTVIQVDAGVTAILTGLTITDGYEIGIGGGGIYNSGSLTISDSTLLGNTASATDGGGIYNAGSLTVSSSTLSGNTDAGNGGGIYNTGTLTVTDSTFFGNAAALASSGGGIYSTGTLTLSNSTLSGNSAAGNGGGIYNSGTTTLLNTIIAANSATSGDPDFKGVLGSGSTNNLIGNGTGMSGIVNGTGGNRVGTGPHPLNPLLASLANNGGPTETMALQFGSPAINAGGALTTLSSAIGSGDGTFTLARAAAVFSSPGTYLIQINSEQILLTSTDGTSFTATRGYNGTTAASHVAGAGVILPQDQRNLPRVGTVDIGAFEFQQTTPTVVAIDGSGTYNGAAFVASATVNGAASLESVTPSLKYYSGTSAAGTALTGVPSTAGTYTVLASFAGSSDYTCAAGSTTFTISRATPTVHVADNGGTYNGAVFAAIETVAGVGSETTPAAGLEGVTPRLTYFAGTNPAGSALSGAPSVGGTYTVLASFAGSADYTSRAASTMFVITQANLSISTTASTPALIAGGSLTYSIVVTNVGSAVAQNVVLADALPAGTSYVSQSEPNTPGANFTLATAGNGLHDTLANLAPGSSATFTIAVTVAAGLVNATKLGNTATVSTTSVEPAGAVNSSSATTTVVNAGAALVPDPYAQGQTDLVVAASARFNDVILVSPTAHGAVTVTLDGNNIGTYAPTGRIVMYAGAGNDTLSVSTNETLPAYLYAGSGNDSLTGGGGPNVLVGGPGRDVLMGGPGRNVEIGGSGSSRLYAGTLSTPGSVSGQSILIGGTTAYDHNDAALHAILQEWESPTIPFATRVSNLRSGIGAPVLNSSTITLNAVADLLMGSASPDWFWSVPGTRSTGVQSAAAGSQIN